MLAMQRIYIKILLITLGILALYSSLFITFYAVEDMRSVESDVIKEYGTIIIGDHTYPKLVAGKYMLGLRRRDYLNRYLSGKSTLYTLVKMTFKPAWDTCEWLYAGKVIYYTTDGYDLVRVN